MPASFDRHVHDSRACVTARRSRLVCGLALGVMPIAASGLVAAGCSLEGFATEAGAGGAAGTPSAAGAGGQGTAGAGAAGHGGGCAPCACGAWDEVRLSDAGPATAPSLAWAGDGWAVSWQDARDGNEEIYFARADASGERLGDELRVTTQAAASIAPQLVWTGATHAIAYEDGRTGNSAAYLALVDAAGSSVTQDLEVWKGSGAPRLPAVAWSGPETGYLLAWEDFRDAGYKIHTGAVAADGTAPSTDVRLTDAAGNANHVAMAYGQLEYGIVWHDSRDGDLEIYFARTDRAGYRIGLEQRVSQASGESLEPAIAFTGTGWGVAWTDGRAGNSEIYFASLTEGGALVGSELRLTDDPASSEGATIAYDGSSFAVAWHDDREGASAIFFQLVGSDGMPRGPAVRIAGTVGTAEHPSLAWSGQAWAVAWQETRDAGSAIYLATCAP